MTDLVLMDMVDAGWKKRAESFPLFVLDPVNASRKVRGH